MLDAGNSIPEIKKTVGGREALTIMSYMDLYNWRQEVEKTRGNFSESRSDAVELLGRMESKGYLASAMIGEDNRLDCIFFMHPKSLEEVKWRGQVLNVDAMYKVNNLDMSLISVQSVSNLGGVQLSTVPIAYGIARRETTEVYTWFLQMLKDRAYNQLCKAPVIVTDKSAALMAAIRSVFPASLSIICTWHIFENFKKNLSDVFKDKNDKELCMNLVQDMINSRTEDQYQRSYKKYQVIASNKSLLKDPESLKALNYFDLNWEPIKHMWAGYRTKELCHFDCTTTQRVEGSHAVLKRSVALSSRTNLADMFDIIDKHIKEFYIKANQSLVKEGRVVDALVRSASYMQNLIGKVSAWALVNIHTNALKAFELEESKVERCHCVDPIWFLIPCQHQLFEYVCGSQNTKIPLCAINRRWHLHPEEESAEAAAADTTSDSTADVNVLLEITLLERSDSMQRLLNKIELAFRNCTNLNETYHLEDCINEGLALHEQFLDSKKQPSQLPLPGTVPKLGRPAKEKAYSAWRDVKPSNKVEPVKAESLKLPKKRKAVEQPVNDEDLPLQKRNIIDVKNPKGRYIHPDIPKDIVVKVWNPLGDGNCGFRALAWQIYGFIDAENVDDPATSEELRVESNAYQRMKSAMLRQLEKNEAQYRSCFQAYFDVNELKALIRSKSQWYSVPECAQLTADTFGRPIAIYPARGSSIEPSAQ